MNPSFYLMEEAA